MLTSLQILIAAGMALAALSFVVLSIYLLGRGIRFWWQGKSKSLLAGRSPLFVLLVHAFALTILLTYYYASRVEPGMLVTKRYAIISPKVRDPVRIVLVGDLLWPSSGVTLERLCKRVNSLRPHVLMVSGDMVADGGNPEEVGAMLAEISAPWKFGCVGNHRPSADRSAYVTGGVRALEDESVFVRASGWSLHVTGLSRFGSPADFQHEKGALEVLLTHTPERVPEAAAAGFELYLCGHTHGGQVRFPFAPDLFVPGKLGWLYPVGRFRVEDMNVIVTKGVGMLESRAPRVRFMCYPEICLVEIVPEKVSGSQKEPKGESGIQ